MFISHFISQEFIKIIGQAAMDSASILAKQVDLSDENVEQLIDMESSDIVSHPKNIELKSLVDGVDFSYDYRCIYVLHKLAPDQVKYTVTKENRGFFKTTVGTPLEIIWLLDVPILLDQGESIEDYYARDIERYTYLQKDVTLLFHQAKPNYSYMEDEYGKFISGYAPIWSTEGNFIGYLGLDIKMDTYKSYRDKMLVLMGILFIFTTVGLAILFSKKYIKHVENTQDQIYTDALTGAYNRRYYNEHFQDIVKANRRNDFYIAVMMVDVDDFKEINDRYGHEKGDECLLKISKVLKRKSLDLVVRYGGDEFIVGCFVKDEQELSRIINEMIEDIRSLSITDDGKKISLSIGACIAHKNSLGSINFEALMSKADENLYIAKKNGKNQFHITVYQHEV